MCHGFLLPDLHVGGLRSKDFVRIVQVLGLAIDSKTFGGVMLLCISSNLKTNLVRVLCMEESQRDLSIPP